MMSEVPLPPRVEALAKNLAADAAAARVVKAVQSRGIESILLRGAALRSWLGYEPDERRSLDADLLVRADDIVRVEALLRELGFSESDVERAFPDQRPGHAHTWVSGAGVVDLHVTLVGISAPPVRAWEVLSRKLETIRLAQVDVPVLDAPRRALVVALHAAQHPEARPVVEDLRRALESVPREVWERARGLSSELGAEDAFAAGLRRLERGAALAEDLGLRRTTPAELTNRGGDAFHLAQGLLWLRGTPRGEMIGYLGRKFVPSSDVMRARSGLANRGAVGLGLAHLLRWLRLLRSVPLAVYRLRTLRRSRGSG